ncbi:hypothetical protein [Epilithonimonas sp.]|jgi:hypothetical protein|uniref:hypothetical protein n=1 Tax=Epilithonimonas sp. TaxID=2894511 RepID=UPI0035B0C71B
MENTIIHLTKPFIVIWDLETQTIVTKMTDNNQTWTSGQNGSAEFDTEQELEDFITESNLTQ